MFRRTTLSQRQRVERDARAGAGVGAVGLDAVVARLVDADAAAVAAQLVALDDGVAGERQRDGVAGGALDQVVERPACRPSRRPSTPKPLVVNVLASMRLSLEGSSSAPTAMPPPRLPSRVLPTMSLSLARIRVMAEPPDSVISLPSMRLAWASSSQMASPVLDVSRLSCTQRAARAGGEVDAVGVADDLVVADRVAGAVVVGVGEHDAGLLVGLQRHRADDVAGDARVELDAEVELADRAVGDRHAVVARVEDAGALAHAVEAVAVEVDGDVRARR